MYHHNKFGIVAIEMGYVPAPSYLLRRSRILEFANRFKPGNLLEIGCGGGGVLYDMAQKGFNCTAIETSHEARKVAQYIALQAGFQIPILEGIQDVKGCQFDYVYSFEVLEHIEDDQTALQDWGLLLRDGGHLLISVPAHMKKWGIDDETIYKYGDLSIKSDDYSNYDDVKSAALAILEIKEKGLDAWLGSSLSTTLLGDTSRYKNTITTGLGELEEFLKGYNIL